MITGRCLCGQVCYQTNGPPERVGHCHCDMCRRASGAVAFTLAVFDRDQVQWQGQLKHYQSSKTASRGFCAQCGTPLTYEPINRPTKVLISLGSMDEPDKTPAEFSLFTREKIKWLHLDEDLIQYPGWVDN